MDAYQAKKDSALGRYTATATYHQMEQMQILMDELRWSRSKILRLAIELMFETHRNDPKRYGV